MILFVFLLWKVVDFVIAFFASKFIPYLGFFAYQKDLVYYHLPKIVSSFANFDGLYYLRIAQNGYQQYEQAFFPLYPLLIRGFSNIFLSNKLIIGLVISNFSFLLGLYFFQKYLKELGINSYWPIIFLLSFPTSFFFGAVYTEGLFFLLVILSLYFLKKRHFLTGVFGFIAALTRLTGVFLVIPFVLELVNNFKNNHRFWKLSLITITPILGLITYMRYLLKTTGDQFYFFHSQTVFGPARSTRLVLLPQVFYRYLRIFFTTTFFITVPLEVFTARDVRTSFFWVLIYSP